MRAYIGITKCCNRISAVIVDDEHTTAKEVADFAIDMQKSNWRLEHREFAKGELKLQRCHKYDEQQKDLYA